MEKSVIFEIFGELKQAQLVRSEQEFCLSWLGRSECYLRTLRFKCRKPSAGTIALCADRLRQGSVRMEKAGDTKKAIKLRSLSAMCEEELSNKLYYALCID